MASVTLFACGIAIILIVLYLLKRIQQYNLPPGPFPLPLIGNLLSLSRKLHITFYNWNKVYGPIITVHLGSIRTVVLSDTQQIRQAFSDPVFHGRPRRLMGLINPISQGKYGILSVDGEHWSEQRRFTMRHLRDFGFGKKSMESLIEADVQDCLSWLKNNEGLPVAVKERFTLAVVNSLWTIMTGIRYEHDDPKLKAILDEGNESFKEFLKKAYLMFFPGLIEKVPNLVGYNKILDGMKPMIKIFNDIIISHVEDPAPEIHPRDFTDVYLTEIKRTTDPTSTFFGEVGKSNLLAVLGDIYGSGLMTQTSTLNWTILYLVRFPKVQTKLQEEIDKAVNSNRMPRLSDKAKIPYCEALMMEVLRYSEHNSMGLFHYTLDDTSLGGYDIPKDTMIIANVYPDNHSETLWKNPFEFKPERFLDGTGTKVLKFEHFIPFSCGKRACLGESLARDTFFLFITSIFQRFDVIADPNKSIPSLEPGPDIFMEPQEYKVVFTDRIK